MYFLSLSIIIIAFGYKETSSSYLLDRIFKQVSYGDACLNVSCGVGVEKCLCTLSYPKMILLHLAFHIT
jgi:hypothetical protein